MTSADGVSFSADYLVLAMGSQPNFFNTPGADAHAFPLYRLEDAERLRSRLLAVLEDALPQPEARRSGRAELRGRRRRRDRRRDCRARSPTASTVSSRTASTPPRHRRGRIYLIDPAPVVLAPFSDRVHTYAQEALEKMGVTLELGVQGHRDHADRVVLSDGREILTRVVVWAGGIKAPDARRRARASRRVTAVGSTSPPT